MSVEKNLKASERYHELDPDIMDEILTPDFKGEEGSFDFSWGLEDHKKAWRVKRANHRDEILEQFGAGDKVCTRFRRIGRLDDGSEKHYDLLQIKTFRNGKIAHIWEYFDRKQIDELLGKA